MLDAIPLAHVSHYIWVMYIPAVLIVVWSIARSVLAQRREASSPGDDAGAGDSGHSRGG